MAINQYLNKSTYSPVTGIAALFIKNRNQSAIIDV